VWMEISVRVLTQWNRRDDYAFFLKPVDATLIPGYTDVIKNPMDFGTMTSKVERGKYRSLEDFVVCPPLHDRATSSLQLTPSPFTQSDFRLVTMNAKIFNPAGSIYHSEAERIEAWGLDHISKASAHVIEYETNWNIEIENDDDDPGGGGIVNVNIDDEDMSTPRDVDGSMPGASPAPSATPAPTLGRRGPRGSRKAQAGASSTISESLDAEGRLPGSKEGVGAFPPGTPFSELMVALKMKGKRYKTKKERLRFEKEGPPYSADGSLDYAESKFSHLLCSGGDVNLGLQWKIHSRCSVYSYRIHLPVHKYTLYPLIPPVLRQPLPSSRQPPQGPGPGRHAATGQ